MNTNCEHFGRCGGCTYLDIPYDAELKLKESDLLETLGEYAPYFTKLHPAPAESAYRNKMEIAFGDDGPERNMALGMRKQRSFYEVATPTHCVLIHDDFKKIITYTLQHFTKAGEEVFHRKRHTGALRHLVLRRGHFTGEILLNLSTTSTLKNPLDGYVAGLLALELEGNIVGILNSINDGVADAVKNENVTILHGQDFYMEEICGLRFKISAFSFFQTNSDGAQKLYSIVKDYALGAGNKLAYDLYCGTGTIAQILSPSFDHVLGIEIVADAVDAAKENTALNNITNCQFYAGDVMELVKTHTANPCVTIEDPPRDGLHPKAIPHILALNSPRLVYVACKPKSLTRDLALLTAAGYQLEKIEGMDMFPRTPHVEAVALLNKIN